MAYIQKSQFLKFLAVIRHIVLCELLCLILTVFVRRFVLSVVHVTYLRIMDALDSSIAQGLAQDREKLEEHLIFVLLEELLQQKSVVVGGC
jgi:hypothetical protein